MTLIVKNKQAVESVVSMTAYIPSLPPFRDFLVIYDKADFTFPANDQQCLFFSGLAFIEGRCITDRVQMERALRDDLVTLDDVRGATGVFSTIFCGGGHIYVHNDLVGMEPISYFENDKFLLVSNRLHALSRAMQLLNIRRAPNYPPIFVMLSCKHHFFDQPYSNETPVLGMFMLAPDEYFRIGKPGVERCKKAAFSGLFDQAPLPRTTYSALIEQGSAEIVQNLSAMIESENHRHFKVDLSGGRDSRTVLAAVLRSGKLASCSFNSYQSWNPKDFDIGVMLTTMFNAQFYQGDDRIRYSKSAAFALTVWRSMKAWLHHRIGISRWFSFRDVSTMRLIGGCGELCRDHWYGTFKRYLGLSETLSDELRLERLFAWFSKAGKLSASCRDAASAAFVDSILKKMPGETLAEKISSHYLFFRNRFHYGVSNYNAFSHEVDWSPYQSLSLLRAAFGSSFEDRERKLVQFDIIDALAPILNFVEFDDGKWPDDILRRSRGYPELSSRRLGCDLEAARADWEAAQTRAKVSVDRGCTVVDPPWVPRELPDLIGREALRCLAELRAADEILASSLGEEFESSLAEELRSPKIGEMSTASKLMSIYDLCFDEDTESLDISSLPKQERYLEGFAHITIFDGKRRTLE